MTQLAETLTKKQIAAFQTPLLIWFLAYGRHNLPWQTKKTAYKVWVSEIMLQQTQVKTVIPYFQAFMKRFPNIKQLALASLDDILKQWAGLGYYRRARYLHECAKQVFHNHNSRFPRDLTSLMLLPGIGQSTAGAILSLAMNKRATILDGNVKRVLARYFALELPINKQSTHKVLWKLADQLTPYEKFNHYNQAMMDMGATCCTRRKPSCCACPLHKGCLALANNTMERIPMREKSPKKKPTRSVYMLICRNKKNAILLHQRDLLGIWPGLISLPEIESLTNINQNFCKHHGLMLTIEDTLKPFKHLFTHFTLTITPVLCQVDRCSNTLANNLFWHDCNSPLPGGVPAPVSKILNQLGMNTLMLN